METDELQQQENGVSAPDSLQQDGAEVQTPAEIQTQQDTDTEKTEETETDYRALAASDLAEVKRLAPALGGLSHLGAMPNAARFGELREMGLSVSEALGALGHLGKSENRAHLRSSVPRRVGIDAPRMSYGELEQARRLFPEMSEREIARLYRRVNA